MSSTDITQNKHLQNLQKILNFHVVAIDEKLPSADHNIKTNASSVVQRGMRKTTVSLKPIRQRSGMDKLEAILSFAAY